MYWEFDHMNVILIAKLKRKENCDMECDQNYTWLVFMFVNNMPTNWPYQNGFPSLISRLDLAGVSSSTRNQVKVVAFIRGLRQKMSYDGMRIFGSPSSKVIYLFS